MITGASGFVGLNLSRFLEERQHDVLRMSLRNPNWKLDNRAQALIHLAGKAHDTANTAAEEEYFKINTELTKKLFDAFLQSEIKDFFYFSSVKASADTVQEILDENHESNPKTPYGRSKLLAEEYLLSFNPLSQKRLFIIRPCMIHGPGNKGNLNLLYALVRKGIPWPLASFNNCRSFLSIDNLNYLIENMLQDKNIASGIYNFSDDKCLSTNDLVEIIGESAGSKSRLWKINIKLISGLAKIGDLTRLPLNSERLRKLTESYIVSNQKIKAALGIEKLPLSAEKGLEKTFKSFQK